MNLSMTGIVAGALGGGAQAVQGMAQQDIDYQHRGELAAQQSQIELDKAKAIEDYKVAIGNSQRTKMANDVTARAGLIGRQVTPAVDGNNPSAFTPASAPLSTGERAQSRQQAAEELGYITPEQAATTNTHLAGMQYQNQRMQDRLDTMERTSSDRNATQIEKQQMQIDGALERAGLKADGKMTHERLATILNSANGSIKLLQEGDRGRTPEAKAAWQQQMDDANILRGMAMAGLKAGMLSKDTQTTSKPTGKTGSGNSRSDVQDALKIWNNGN